MKKIISLVVLLILLIGTWNLIHSTPSVTFETHSIMQDRLADIIKTSLKKNRPSAQNFALVRLWTETLASDRVRAHFIYRFKEGTGTEAVDQTISGEAFLQKTSGDSSKQENWKVEKVQTSGNQVIFEDVISVTPEAETKPQGQ